MTGRITQRCKTSTSHPLRANIFVVIRLAATARCLFEPMFSNTSTPATTNPSFSVKWNHDGSLLMIMLIFISFLSLFKEAFDVEIQQDLLAVISDDGYSEIRSYLQHRT